MLLQVRAIYIHSHLYSSDSHLHANSESILKIEIFLQLYMNASLKKKLRKCLNHNSESIKEFSKSDFFFINIISIIYIQTCRCYFVFLRCNCNNFTGCIMNWLNGYI